MSLLISFLVVASTLQDPAPPQAEDAPPSVQLEVLNNIRGQAVGPVTVAELALPEPFLKRFADRIILASFEDNFRQIVRDEPDEHDPAKAENAPKDGVAPPSTTPPPAATPKSPANAPASSPPGGSAPSESGMNALQIGLAVVGIAAIVGLLALRRRAA